eukprot:Rmarinus@m.10357
MPSSRGRVSTASSGRYRTVARTSHVDESLFGDPLKDQIKKRGKTPGSRDGLGTGENGELTERATPKFGRRAQKNPQVETITHEERRGVNELILPTANSIVLTQYDINALKDLTLPNPDSALKVATEDLLAQGADKLSNKARARLDRQKELERKQNAKGGRRGPDAEEQAADATVARAQRLKQEEWDEVKNMNQKILYAQCVTIRDKQLDEKRAIASERKRIERQLDAMMEKDRVFDLKRREEEEELRRRKQREAANIITEQIKANERERIRQHELRELEGKMMLEQVRKFNVEEEKKEQQRIEKGKVLLDEILTANKQAIEEKRRKKEEELDEDIRIAEYLKVQDKKLQEREDRERKEREQKELLTAKLRAQQQKVIDSKAMEDELRARRAYEEAERQYRDKERREAERRARQRQDIIEYSERQKEVRIKAIAAKAEEEREEFDNNLQWSREQDRIMREMEAKKRSAAMTHASELRKQIDENDERRENSRQSYLQEGQELRRRFETERDKKETIKQEKLEIMREMGVPDKYQAELMKMKIEL